LKSLNRPEKARKLGQLFEKPIKGLYIKISHLAIDSTESYLKSMDWPFFNLFGKGDAAFIFYAHVHACSLSYTDEE